ncbi:hypothetical protein [Oceanobacillus sojae]|uniref:hypothetical protein n=1 Tax=Oceanobacillus sojae TaxID=582851 RepID=UPI0021A41C40|nr:hypothetical protein [Oceanobacillus sojae]MCT1902969.1 hypothetical protein [Oceanobacillus sojae]
MSKEVKVTNEALMLAIKELIQKVDNLGSKVTSLEGKVDKVDSKLDVLSIELLSTRADVNILKKAK